jgi:tRNA-dihydrouridine synthase
MLGRATRGRPFLPGTAFAALQGRRPRRFSGEELAAAVIDHAMLLADSEGERRGMLKMRKHAHWYLVAAKARYKKAAVHKIDSVAGLRSFLEGVAWPD